MNRRLIFLNAVLAIVVVYGGVQLRNEYKAAKAREASLRRARITPAPAPPFVPLPSDAPVLPSGYKDVAMKNLFHPSRDPNVPVELPPPPPPPPPMPELPRYHGQMNLGDGPMALLVEKPGMSEKALKPGDTIGQFKLVDVNTSEITFAWMFNGALARRSLRDLADNTVPAARPLPPLHRPQPRHRRRSKPIWDREPSPASAPRSASPTTARRMARWSADSRRCRSPRPSANPACGIR